MDYTDLKRRLRDDDHALVQRDRYQAAAAIDALEAEVARVSALAGIALDGWQSWVDDQLQGTSYYDETIAEVNATLTAPTPQAPDAQENPSNPPMQG
jgi:hypothetical protein